MDRPKTGCFTILAGILLVLIVVALLKMRSDPSWSFAVVLLFAVFAVVAVIAIIVAIIKRI